MPPYSLKLMNNMINKKEIKYLASLKNKKFRFLNNEFVIEGEKLILEALKHKQNIKKIIYSAKGENFDAIRTQSKEYNIELALCTNRDSEKISDTKNSQQIFALLACKPLTKINQEHNNITGPVVIIDGISDPGNMGTILRTCSWFGIYNIMISSDSVEFYNPKTVRSSMGAHFHIKNIYRDSIGHIIEYLESKKYVLLAADIRGKNIKEYKTKNNSWALILGNEARGLSNISKEKSQLIHIRGEETMESLNVAEAASIIMHSLYQKI